MCYREDRCGPSRCSAFGNFTISSLSRAATGVVSDVVASTVADVVGDVVAESGCVFHRGGWLGASGLRVSGDDRRFGTGDADGPGARDLGEGGGLGECGRGRLLGRLLDLGCGGIV